ncbi:LYR motif-containing protein 4 isoform X1 [Oenanthe melanoleuca]|uniref:LYR motif-containing protein 4 isoform X1 n=1 Tax=Oenanthe melanoleuca TaxID=2939378 RepID=UPI0024C10698|nr:LYR motif-containing protein 4 isoform X1 [Oenanthe melanoleuca]
MQTDAPDSKLSSWPQTDPLQHMNSDCKCAQRFRGNSQHTSLVAPPACPPRVAHRERGSHTALLPPPSTASQRWFRFPGTRAFPPRPRPLTAARHAPRGSRALGSPPELRAGPTRRDPVTGPESPEPTAPTAAPAGHSLFPAPPLPCAGPGPSRGRSRSATHRRPCGSAPPRLRPSQAAGERAGKRGLAAGGAARCRQHGSVQPCPGAAAVPRPAAGEPALRQLQLQVTIGQMYSTEKLVIESPGNT